MHALCRFQYPIAYPKLAADAVPTIFPGCPKYFNKTVSKRRILKKFEYIPKKRQKITTDLPQCKIIIVFTMCFKFYYRTMF